MAALMFGSSAGSMVRWIHQTFEPVIDLRLAKQADILSYAKAESPLVAEDYVPLAGGNTVVAPMPLPMSAPLPPAARSPLTAPSLLPPAMHRQLHFLCDPPRATTRDVVSDTICRSTMTRSRVSASLAGCCNRPQRRTTVTCPSTGAHTGTTI